MEKIILEDIDILGLNCKATIIHKQYRFIKVISCLSKLISHYDKVTYTVNKRKTVNAIFTDFFFFNVFHSVPYGILLNKFINYGKKWVHTLQGNKQV